MNTRMNNIAFMLSFSSAIWKHVTVSPTMESWNLNTKTSNDKEFYNCFIHPCLWVFYMWNPFFFKWNLHSLSFGNLSQNTFWVLTDEAVRRNFSWEGLEFMSFVFVMGGESWRNVGNCLTPLYCTMRTFPFSVHPLCLNFLVWVSLTNSKQWEER